MAEIVLQHECDKLAADPSYEVSADVLATIPRLDKAAALRGWPAPERDDWDDRRRRVHSYVAYRKRRKMLLDKVRAQEKRAEEERRAKNPKWSPYHRCRGDPLLWLDMVDAPSQRPVTHPEPMPVDVPPRDEFRSLQCSLRRGPAARPKEGYQQFTRGAVYSDGRLDLCKQVPGPQWIQNIVDAAAKGASVEHFLMGNSIVGHEGARAISEWVLRDRPAVQTWYLAGNNLDGASVELLADALQDDPNVRALWLKRNPLGKRGAAAIARLLRGNNQLEVLDLHNCNLGDEGAEIVAAALPHAKRLRSLYVDGNGIGPRGATALGNMIHNCGEGIGLTHLYACMNPLGDDGVAALTRGFCASDIRVLAVSSCRFGPSGLSRLVANVWHTKIESLNVGHYKATADMGEVPNSFGIYGAAPLCRLLTYSKTLRALEFNVTHMPDVAVRLVAEAAREHGRVSLLRAEQYGFPTTKETRDVVRAVSTMNEEERRPLQHTERVVHIDSIYRNAM